MPQRNAKPKQAPPFPADGRWTEQQLKLAFHLYCLTPFGRLHRGNPDIIRLAEQIGRTPSALAMKLSNFASLDPAIVKSGRKGLSGASAQDRAIWAAFHADWEQLTHECEQLYEQLQTGKGAADGLLTSDGCDLDNYHGETREVVVQQRKKQAFFRRAVLASYRGRCCISGVSDPRLLIASHIVPWREDKANRLNPSNGLCLSAIHDKAFDQHLFTLSDDGCIVLSATLKQTPDTFLREVFWSAEGRAIEMPERFSPNATFLARHREVTLHQGCLA